LIGRFFTTLGLLTLAGVLLSLAHPSALPGITTTDNYILNTGWQEIFAWVGLVPLFFALRDSRGWRLFLWGFYFSTVYFGLSLAWLNIAMAVYGHLPIWLSLIVYGLLMGYMGLMWGSWIFWSFYIHRRLRVSLPFAFAVCYAPIELTRNYLLYFGFPWQNLAYSQYLNLPLLQTAAIWGIHGIAFMIVLANGIFYELWRWRKSRGAHPFPRAAVVTLVALLGFSYAYGVYRLSANERLEAAAPKFKAAMVQGNIDQTMKNQSAAYAPHILKVYQGLSLQAPEDVELVIWPEASFPYGIRDDIASLARVMGSAWPSRAPWHMLIGISSYLNVGRQRHYYNTGFLFDPEMNVLGKSAKSHLVPFGEFVPFGDFFGIDEITPFAGSFKPGQLGKGLSFDGYRFGVLICYEGIFPEITREYVEMGMEFLVNITNDAWYGVSAAPYQHLAFYAFRTVEARKALLRTANTGFTGAIDTSGRIVQNSKLFTRTLSIASVPRLTEKTLYARTGDVFAWACLAAMLFWMVKGIVPQRAPLPAAKKHRKR